MTVMDRAPARTPRRALPNYAQNPMLVYWEMTQACALACRHCRAEAMPYRHPQELNYAESRRLLRQLTGFGEPLPHLILTGGDPATRADLVALVDEANALGLRVSITPSATPDLTRDLIARLKAHGILSLGLSLDGSSAARHDRMRGIPGCFDWTVSAAREALALGLAVQVNTLVAVETADDLPAIYELLKPLPIMRWSLFFLIGVGRGRVLREVAPEEGEAVMNWVHELARTAPFEIKTTEAPSYRRITLERMRAEGLSAEQIRGSSVYRGFRIRDGHGIMFISHVGDIYPAGFLPLAAGNVRQDDPVQVYRDAPLFRALHDAHQLKGKCGDCEYRVICGGSRARAFAHTGDPLQSDPLCVYQPAAHSTALE